ncbi:hypothetical protein PoB_001583300 [Plakobranchus ocellatus]|uniref:Uncharacterized protein n=1 Tax=Plakobranchus ocellatus TaxID=259542 RepID=A0AAV3Z3K6_9GAST|nr:hypothetical protein PoB_001583300 [Plakobranchus ocellatus]
MASNLFNRDGIQMERAGPSEVERFEQETSFDSALVNAVRDQIERSMQPLRMSVDEIKASVARELEEERVLLRDHLAAAQKEIMAQLQEIRHIQDQQLNQSEPCHHHQPDKDILAEKTNVQEQLVAKQVQQEILAEGQEEGIMATGERSDVKGRDHQMPAISRDLMWFKEQVQLLQNEHKQYRQELRRQEQQQLLQHRVSVSKLELQDELGRTKDELITSMKALWAFTEAELHESSKTLNEKTTDAVCELSRCQEETKHMLSDILTTELRAVHQLAEETKENVSQNLSKNQVYKTAEETKQMMAKVLTATIDTQAQREKNLRELQKVHQLVENAKETIPSKVLKNLHNSLKNTEMSKIIHNLEAKLDDVHGQLFDTNTISIQESALHNLHMVCVGQAQRAIQTVTSPSLNRCKVFHFYVKELSDLVGSGKSVASLPYVVGIDNSFFIMNGIAHFKVKTSEMILRLKSSIDSRELGFELLGCLKLKIETRVMDPAGLENILVDEQTASFEDAFPGERDESCLQLGAPVSCHKLLSSGYNSFKGGSVLIQFKITIVQEQRSNWNTWWGGRK